MASGVTGLADPEFQASLDGLVEQPVFVMVQAVLNGVGSDSHRVDEVHQLFDLSSTGLPNADKTGPFPAEVRLGDLLVEWDMRQRRVWRERGPLHDLDLGLVRHDVLNGQQ